jgi:hypothetical protein
MLLRIFCLQAIKSQARYGTACSIVEVRQNRRVPELLRELDVCASIRHHVDAARRIQRLQTNPVILVGLRLRQVEQGVL